MTPEMGNCSRGEAGGADAVGRGSGVLTESSLQRRAAINTGRTLGVPAVRTNIWTALSPPHRPKAWTHFLIGFSETVRPNVGLVLYIYFTAL